jgi:predicted AAA+ superfamily ATPase
MKRLIDEQLEHWKNQKRRKPLIIRGVRQVGKTWSVKEFGRKFFSDILLIDFERNPELKRLFIADLNPKRICAELEVIHNKTISPEQTLLFLDEIQECPSAIQSLRYFYEEYPELHVIAAGSLLEFSMNEFSFPVGRIQFIWMHPLGFSEFLMATGNEKADEIIHAKPERISDTLHAFLLDLLRKYILTGGMPESVRTFVETVSYQESLKVLAELVNSYRLDFPKYSPRVDKDCLNSVLNSVSQSIGQQTKYAHLADGFTNPTIKKAYQTLEKADIFHKIPSVYPDATPLGINVREKVFKTLMVDVGLMHHFRGIESFKEFMFSDLMHLYKGAIAEQFVGQELNLSQNRQLYYWSRQAKSSNAEVDYVIQVGDSVYPVEVKSASAGRLKSLHLFLDTYKNTPEGLIFYTGHFAVLPQQKIKFIPLYYANSVSMKEYR